MAIRQSRAHSFNAPTHKTLVSVYSETWICNELITEWYPASTVQPVPGDLQAADWVVAHV